MNTIANRTYNQQGYENYLLNKVCRPVPSSPTHRLLVGILNGDNTMQQAIIYYNCHDLWQANESDPLSVGKFIANGLGFVVCQPTVYAWQSWALDAHNNSLIGSFEAKSFYLKEPFSLQGNMCVNHPKQPTHYVVVDVLSTDLSVKRVTVYFNEADKWLGPYSMADGPARKGAGIGEKLSFIEKDVSTLSYQFSVVEIDTQAIIYKGALRSFNKFKK